MAIWWVDPVDGDNANDGSTFALAKKNIANGLAVLDTGTQGDILNLVNTGTHDWPTSRTDITTLAAGTSYSDPTCIIRGTDSSGNPAMATIAPTAAGVHRMVRFRDPSAYAIVENLIFDASSQPSDASDYSAVEFRDNAVGPIWVRYCTIIGGVSGAISAGKRSLLTVDTTPSTQDLGMISYCYFQNIADHMETDGLAGQKIRTKNCIFINDSINARTRHILDFAGPLIGDSNRLMEILNCTVYDDCGSGDFKPFIESAPGAVDIGTVNCYSNLLWVESSGTVEEFMAGNISGATKVGTINSNVLLGGPSVTAGSLQAATGWYQVPWDANDDDAVAPDTWPLDTVAYGEADTDVFNDPDSAYDWELPNGLSITILKDLRPIKYTSAGLWGSTPGALPKVGEDDPSDPGDPASIPFLDVRPFYTTVMKKSILSRLETTLDRVLKDYLRDDEEDADFREFGSKRIEVGVSSEYQIITGIETTRHIFLESDSPIEISAGATNDNFLPGAKMMLIAGGEYSLVRLKNTSSTTAANTLITVVD